MKKTVPITYDPNSDIWDAENPVSVAPGVTHIEWTISLKALTGTIKFGTEPGFQGISFNNRDWPGTHPKGDGKVWMTTLDNKLKPGDPPQQFHYTINALFQQDELTPPTRISWDPDVEEETPPPPAGGGNHT
jgi:hypothetical protein